MNGQPKAFDATRWTLVLRARGKSEQARVALAELCETYYASVLHFLQREGRIEDDARELTQAFFATVLTGAGFEAADPERGRFRSYLLGALKHFLSDQRKSELRFKRGAGVRFESLEGADSEEQAGLEVADDSPSEMEARFDREWALAAVGRGMALLEQEFARSGKPDQFSTLKPWLMGEPASLSQADAARSLRLSEGAVKVAIHRLRKRFREAVRSEISQTLHDPSQLDDEMRHLINALA